MSYGRLSCTLTGLPLGLIGGLSGRAIVLQARLPGGLERLAPFEDQEG
jgi:hypothetical protein